MLVSWRTGRQGDCNLLFGEISPSGKLPVTFYNDVRDLPKFDDYAMKNRTYRYYRGEVQYPFGYGLTYTRFQLTACSLHGQMLRCTVRNTGEVACDEVLQLYVSAPQAEYQTPLRSLIAVKRLPLGPGEEKEVLFALRDDDLYSVNETGDTVFYRVSTRCRLAMGRASYPSRSPISMQRRRRSSKNARFEPYQRSGGERCKCAAIFLFLPIGTL